MRIEMRDGHKNAFMNVEFNRKTTDASIYYYGAINSVTVGIIEKDRLLRWCKRVVKELEHEKALRKA
jgi:hypothetical protein